MIWAKGTLEKRNFNWTWTIYFFITFTSKKVKNFNFKTRDFSWLIEGVLVVVILFLKKILDSICIFLFRNSLLHLTQHRNYLLLFLQPQRLYHTFIFPFHHVMVVENNHSFLLCNMLQEKGVIWYALQRVILSDAPQRSEGHF